MNGDFPPSSSETGVRFRAAASLTKRCPLAAFKTAHVAEIARGAIQSIHFGQTDAGKAIGLTFRQRLQYVIMPQAVRRFLPPWINAVADAVKLFGRKGLVELVTVMGDYVMVGMVMTAIDQHLPVRVDDMLGRSFDIFHKNPSHQRTMLADASRLPHSTKIRVGPETLNLRVTAVNDEKGQYLGPMLTWAVVMAPTSEPASGSVSAKAAIASPRATASPADGSVRGASAGAPGAEERRTSIVPRGVRAR